MVIYILVYVTVLVFIHASPCRCIAGKFAISCGQGYVANLVLHIVQIAMLRFAMLQQNIKLYEQDACSQSRYGKLFMQFINKLYFFMKLGQ